MHNTTPLIADEIRQLQYVPDPAMVYALYNPLPAGLVPRIIEQVLRLFCPRRSYYYMPIPTWVRRGDCLYAHPVVLKRMTEAISNIAATKHISTRSLRPLYDLYHKPN